MAYQKASNSFDCHLLSFLEQHPSLTDRLLMECNYDYSEVIEIINLALQAPTRCQVTSSYIYAVIAGQMKFLVTNLNQKQNNRLVKPSSTWLIGRDSTCAITIVDFSVSRCHAAIGYLPLQKFYITDVGSVNGTWVNRRRLAPGERRTLNDGDLLDLGNLRFEFFLSSRGKQPVPALCEPTYS